MDPAHSTPHQEPIVSKKQSALPAGAEEHAVQILERVWTLSRKRLAATTKRKNLHTERDSIDAEIIALAGKNPSEEDRLSSKWRVVCKQIDRLAVDIKFYSDEIDRAIDEGEQGKFDFLDDDLKPDETLYAKLQPKKPETPADSRPVGVPDRETSPLKFDPKNMRLSTDTAPPEGVDQHLAAAVVELGLADKDTDKLIAAKMNTVADVVKFVDGGGNLMDELSVGQEIKARIMKALKSYRTKHRQAMAEVESGQ